MSIDTRSGECAVHPVHWQIAAPLNLGSYLPTAATLAPLFWGGIMFVLFRKKFVPQRPLWICRCQPPCSKKCSKRNLDTAAHAVTEPVAPCPGQSAWRPMAALAEPMNKPGFYTRVVVRNRLFPSYPIRSKWDVSMFEGELASSCNQLSDGPTSLYGP